jgi:hypothetical protein
MCVGTYFSCAIFANLKPQQNKGYRNSVCLFKLECQRVEKNRSVDNKTNFSFKLIAQQRIGKINTLSFFTNRQTLHS